MNCLAFGTLNSKWQFTGYAQYCHFFDAVSHGNKRCLKCCFVRIGCHDKLVVGDEALIMQLNVDLVLIIGISALKKTCESRGHQPCTPFSIFGN
jgi:hypothetical protein